VPIGEIAASGLTAVDAAQCGLFGKLPARGDFVRAGLPRGFVQPWDDWLQVAIAGSKAQLGEKWLPAWMEAPIWHFALPPGVCGDDAVLGVWMPSVDRAGRHFPLTLAMVLPRALPDPAQVADFLARAEAAGLAALQYELAPDAVMARLAPETALLEAPAAAPDLAPLAARQALWWTEGSPLVPAGQRTGMALPTVSEFITMLDATSTTDSAAAPATVETEAHGTLGEASE
jgi:type VI secretion system protein ImpM